MSFEHPNHQHIGLAPSRMDYSLKTYSFYSSKGSSKAPSRMDSLKSDSFYSSSSSSKVDEVVPPREENVLLSDSVLSNTSLGLSDLSITEKSFNDWISTGIMGVRGIGVWRLSLP